MKYSILFFKQILFAKLIIVLLTSCEDEYKELGAGIINIQNITIQNQTYPVKTYNKRITPFQSNGMPSNLLGYYNDSNFGSTTVEFLAQLTPGLYSPNFGDNTTLDSVVLTIPYYSSRDGDNYTLDSVYGNSPIKLSIYRNNFFLRNFDPASDLDESQRYFSNGALSLSEIMNQNELEGELLFSTNEFLPSNNAITLITRDDDGEIETSETIDPSFRVKLEDNLPLNFWETTIFDKEDSEELSSANNFYNYFRGLYFKVEPLNSDEGSLILMNFSSSNAHLKLFYTYETTLATTDEITERQGSYDLSFSGNRTTLINNNFNTNFLQTINNANDVQGDELLYLKGGEGSMAVIELFAEDENGNGFEEFLEEFREIINPNETNERRVIKRLINEAFIEFYVDESITDSNTDLPLRVYVHDLDNDIPLIDYLEDPTINPATSDSKFFHLVPLATEIDSDGNESRKYKVRITEHVNSIISNDLTNLRLGLFVSSNVGVTNSLKFLNYDELAKGIPTGTALSPKGVILHGSSSNNLLKRAKLNIYYTDLNN